MGQSGLPDPQFMLAPVQVVTRRAGAMTTLGSPLSAPGMNDITEQMGAKQAANEPAGPAILQVLPALGEGGAGGRDRSRPLPDP